MIVKIIYQNKALFKMKWCVNCGMNLSGATGRFSRVFCTGQITMTLSEPFTEKENKETAMNE
jgi:hypothetical protein